MSFRKNIKIQLLCLFIFGLNISLYSQSSIYVNNMDYVLGDAKQAFITNKITTQEQADNLLLGFQNMKVNGIRIPIFPRDTNGVDVNPNKPIMDYFYQQALAQGFDIFANPAQGGGGSRIANNSLTIDAGSKAVKNVQAATEELILRVLEFSAEYPDCKWINPFNEDGRATNSVWSVSQINTIYAALYNNVNGAELIGPCTWGLPAGIDMLQNTNIADYITVASAHNLGFNHSLWDDFIALADVDNLPVWDSEVNHNDKHGTGTRLEKAIENKVDGLVLYNSWNTISLTTGSVNSGGEDMMALYLKPVINLALNGTATQSSTNPKFNKEAHLAIDNDTNGNYGSGSVTVSDSETNPWWQVDLGENKTIGDIKVFNRTDGCCKAALSNFTVSVINNNGIETFSQTYTTAPDPSVISSTGGVQGRIVKVQLNATGALTLAEVQVFAADESLSTKIINKIKVDIYPNPVVNTLKVNAADAVFKQYTIYNINGQVVAKENVNSKKLDIDTSNYPNGIYILKLDGDRFSGSYKVIKE